MAPKRKETSNPKESAAVTLTSHDSVRRRSLRLSNAAVAPLHAPLQSPKRKKPKIKSTTKTATAAEKEEEGEEAAAVDSPGKKKIVIEHCKQCNSFKTRALQVKKALEECDVTGVNVVVNPEKPRRGCFEIREEGEGDKVFVSLLDLKRPFPPLKALDMDKLISDIIEKIR